MSVAVAVVAGTAAVAGTVLGLGIAGWLLMRALEPADIDGGGS
jgi:hypothetical protein